MAFVGGVQTFFRRNGSSLVRERRVVNRGVVQMREGPYDSFFRALADMKKMQAVGSITGRKNKMPVAEKHAVLGTPMDIDFAAEGFETALFGMGCFWGAERKFWQANGVYSTAVGYAGGQPDNPTYKEVCTGRTGHAEVVRVIYDPKKISYETLLDIFWDSHNPTTLNQQGNDVGTQYRSVAYYNTPEQKEAIEKSMARFDQLLEPSQYGPIVTEVSEMPEFFFAEDYHQQYLHKNPWGYCGLGGTGRYVKAAEVPSAKM